MAYLLRGARVFHCRYVRFTVEADPFPDRSVVFHFSRRGEVRPAPRFHPVDVPVASVVAARSVSGSTVGTTKSVIVKAPPVHEVLDDVDYVSVDSEDTHDEAGGPALPSAFAHATPKRSVEPSASASASATSSSGSLGRHVQIKEGDDEDVERSPSTARCVCRVLAMKYLLANLFRLFVCLFVCLFI